MHIRKPCMTGIGADVKVCLPVLGGRCPLCCHGLQGGISDWNAGGDGSHTHTRGGNFRVDACSQHRWTLHHWAATLLRDMRCACWPTSQNCANFTALQTGARGSVRRVLRARTLEILLVTSLLEALKFHNVWHTLTTCQAVATIPREACLHHDIPMML